MLSKTASAESAGRFCGRLEVLMAVTKGVIKVKKKWFTVLAPVIFKEKELSEIAAFEPQNLIGRPAEFNLMQITGIPKDQQKKVIFKIIDTRGEKAITIPWRFYLIESFLQRSSRRFKEKFIYVTDVKTKDGKTATIKMMAMAVRKLHQPVRASLLKKLAQQISEKVPELTSDELFTPANIDKLASDLRKELKQIFPLDKLLVWKLSVQ